MTSALADHSPTVLSAPAGRPSRQDSAYGLDRGVVQSLVERVVCSPTAATFDVVTPMTGERIAQLPLSTVEDAALAVERARAAQPAWAQLPWPRKRAIMLRFHDLVLDRQARLLDLVQLESGKARGHAFEEVADTAMVVRHYGLAAPAYLKTRRRRGAYPVLTAVTESRIPKGVVGIVSPWNYPLSLAITDAIPALIAGNAVVLRPDRQGSLSALTAVQLLAEAGLPEGVLQVVLGDGSVVGQALVDRTDYVCFTGSTTTGRAVAASAGRRLVGASLELGGKNSLYVAADADLRRAVPGAVRACFASAGQLCISAERVLVHEAVYDDFVARFTAAVEAITLGTGLVYGYDMGSLASSSQLELVTAHVEDARAKGARVLTGGRPRPDVGPFVYEPTLLEGVTAAMACRDEETFGPVVEIYKVASDDEAVAFANDTAYGLNASIWTRDVRLGRALAGRIRTGTVNINEGYAAAWASVAAPMGGMKASGISRRHGAEGILKYTETQNVTAQRLLPIAPALGLDDKGYATAMTAALRVLKGMRRR